MFGYVQATINEALRVKAQRKKDQSGSDKFPLGRIDIESIFYIELEHAKCVQFREVFLGLRYPESQQIVEPKRENLMFICYPQHILPDQHKKWVRYRHSLIFLPFSLFNKE